MRKLASGEAMGLIRNLVIFSSLIMICSPQNISRPSVTSADRDAFRNPNCHWELCLKYASTCQTTACCNCMCNTGTSYVTLNRSCIAESKIATELQGILTNVILIPQGCSFMAQTSSTAPWSFRMITATSPKILATGLRIFHCTLSFCVRATACTIIDIQYENNGWQKLPMIAASRFSTSGDLLKLNGEECDHAGYNGLLLLARLQCTTKDQNSKTSNQTSCLILKISGTYYVGTIPDFNSKCIVNSTIPQVASTSIPSKETPNMILTSPLNSVLETMYHSERLYSSFLSTAIVSTARNRTEARTSYAPTRAVSTTIVAERDAKQIENATAEFGSMTQTLSITTHAESSTSFPALVFSSPLKISASIPQDSSSNNYATSSKILKSSRVQVMSSERHTTTAEMQERSSRKQLGSIIQSTIEAVLPNGRKKKTKNVDFVVVSSLIGGLALFIVLVLVIFLFLLSRRKKSQIGEMRRRVIVRRYKDHGEIKENLRCHSAVLPPSPPSQIQLRGMNKKDNYKTNIGTSDRLNLAYSWKSKQGNDDDDDNDYDIPADPPGVERSLSALYAKVDKLNRSFFVDEDDGHRSNSNKNQGTSHKNGRIAANHVYDEPSIIGKDNKLRNTGKKEDNNDDFHKYLTKVI